MRLVDGARVPRRLGCWDWAAAGLGVLPASVSPSTRARQHDDGDISPGERSAEPATAQVLNYTRRLSLQAG